MPSPLDPNQHKVVPLSEVHANRRETEQSDISRADLRNLLAEVIDERVAEKFARLQKSIDLMMVHVGGVQSGEVEDSALFVQKYSQPAFDKIKQEVEREKSLN